VNADDFGFTRDVNEGIIHCHRHGILTATTLMANGDAFDHAVAAARDNPTLDVGCHLVLIGGCSLLSAQRYPESITDLVRALAQGKFRPYEELRAQVERIMEAQLTPRHLDTHKHAHLLPPVLEAVGRLSEDYKIPWVRRPFDLPAGDQGTLRRRMVGGLIEFFRRRRFDAVLKRHHCRFTDHFSGFSLTGYLTAESLTALIGRLPEGVTELMVHPGFLGAELLAARTRLKRSRLIELEALTDPSVREALTANGVELAGYRDL
jgi:predicted glycoside hydrolase/deacetylase ChbG (UPF0249 family)